MIEITSIQPKEYRTHTQITLWRGWQVYVNKATYVWIFGQKQLYFGKCFLQIYSLKGHTTKDSYTHF